MRAWTMPLMISAAIVTSTNVARAQATEPDATAPQFTQLSTNVFRRFSVDLATMKEFYGDVIGLRALPPINVPGGGQMTLFQIGTTESQLKLQSQPSVRPPAGGIREVAGLLVLTFFFPNAAELTARMAAHGYSPPEFHKVPGIGLTGGASALVRDPDGQWVELVVVPGVPPARYESMEIGITASDIERSRAFYRGFVGLKELDPVADPILGTTKYRFQLGTTTINLWTFGNNLPVNTTSAGIQYVVRNVEAVDARAKAQGVRIDRPLGTFGANLRTLWLADPDGVTNYFAEIVRRREKASQ